MVSELDHLKIACTSVHGPSSSRPVLFLLIHRSVGAPRELVMKPGRLTLRAVHPYQRQSPGPPFEQFQYG